MTGTGTKEALCSMTGTETTRLSDWHGNKETWERINKQEEESVGELIITKTDRGSAWDTNRSLIRIRFAPSTWLVPSHLYLPQFMIQSLCDLDLFFI
uniref:Uncharacterized protein n=1 Tax=Picea glauca TaxID=3330 RepID=A0A101LWC4_PICGL|nr:hypothetical protein ABT39_MTgene1869 [Picea glauca]